MIDNDKGWNRIQKSIKLMDESQARVGVQDGSDISKDPSRSLSESVMIASVHEFGSPKRNIPARSFLRSAIDTNRTQIVKLQEKMYKGVIDGSISVRQGIETIGQFGQKIIRKKISSNIPPPLKNPSKKRGGATAKTLVDTGALRQSIHSVERVGKV